MKTEGCQLSAANVEKIDISKFVEADPRQHCMKLLFGMGFYAAFRGSTEHAQFTKNQVSFGTYPENFENTTLAGRPYVAITNISNDKTCTISITNSYARDTNQVLRFPVNIESMKCFGGTIAQFYKKLAPGQVRMYCQVATDSYKQKLALEGFPEAEFYGNKPLGRKSIATYFKDGAKILGLPDTFRPHSLRGACITQLANDGSVSIAETMAVARHTSVSASKNYQRVDGVSEGNRLRALGQLPVDDVKPPAVPTVEAAVAPVKLPATDLTVPASVTVDSESDDEFERFRAKRRRKNSCESEDLSSITRVTTEPPTSNQKSYSLTQMDIQDLKEEMADLEIAMKPKPKPKPVAEKSENRKVVAGLRAAVQRLKKKVDSRDHDILYHRSIKNDFDEKFERLQEQLEQEKGKTYQLERNIESLQTELRSVQRENGELERIVFGSKRRRSSYY